MLKFVMVLLSIVKYVCCHLKGAAGKIGKDGRPGEPGESVSTRSSFGGRAAAYTHHMVDVYPSHLQPSCLMAACPAGGCCHLLLPQLNLFICLNE